MPTKPTPHSTPHLAEVVCVGHVLVPHSEAASCVPPTAWQLHHQRPDHALLLLCVLVCTEVTPLLVQQQLVQPGLYAAGRCIIDVQDAGHLAHSGLQHRLPARSDHNLGSIHLFRQQQARGPATGHRTGQTS